MNIKIVSWILRIAIAGEFIGHGVFAVQGKANWIPWIQQCIHVSNETALQLLLIIGVVDILLGILVLIKPIRLFLLWMALWGFLTALVRPLVGEPIWDFVERWANWGAPLALLLIQGWPQKRKEWLS